MRLSLSETASTVAERGTPAWWRALPPFAQLGVLVTLLPGIVLHELSHAAVAWPWSIRTEFEWSSRTAVDIYWVPETPRWAIQAAYLAPLVFGWVGAWGLVLWVWSRLPLTAWEIVAIAYCTLQLAFYTLPGVGDLLLLMQRDKL